MPLSAKQKKVLAFCHQNDGKITKKQAMELIDDTHCNGEKYVGEVLSRMVKAGLLTREKRGQYKVGKASEPINQQSMF